LRARTRSAHDEDVSWERFEIDPRARVLEAVIEIDARLAEIREDVGAISQIAGLAMLEELKRREAERRASGAANS
jgi:hypothetical protein